MHLSCSHHLFILDVNTIAMSVKVAFEFGRYSVRESCTMLSVTLVVMGKVTQPFTVTVIPVDFRYPSAIGM